MLTLEDINRLESRIEQAYGQPNIKDVVTSVADELIQEGSPEQEITGQRIKQKLAANLPINPRVEFDILKRRTKKLIPSEPIQDRRYLHDAPKEEDAFSYDHRFGDREPRIAGIRHRRKTRKSKKSRSRKSKKTRKH